MSAKHSRFALLLVCGLFAALTYLDIGGWQARSRSLIENERAQREPTHEFKDLRFLTLGGINTFGAVGNRYMAFPYLLSKNVKNLGQRNDNGGPLYQSLCLNSEIGEEIFDVVVLEFNIHASEHLVRLARRLRKRFPEATIIFLRLWYPYQYLNVKTGKGLMRMLKDHPAYDASKFQPAVLADVVETYSPEDWQFIDFQEDAGEWVTKASEAVNGFVFDSPRPENHKKALLDYAFLFQGDSKRLSTRGHEWVRDRILGRLRALEKVRSDEVTPWTSQQDSCAKIMEGQPVPYITDGMSTTQLDEFGEVLEIFEKTSAWIDIHNPSAIESLLYLSHLTAGPEPSMYPDVKVNISSTGEIVTLSGAIKGNFNYPMHQITTEYAGVLPAKETSRVFLETIRPQFNGKEPVRLTSIIVTPKKIKDNGAQDETSDRVLGAIQHNKHGWNIERLQ